MDKSKIKARGMGKHIEREVNVMKRLKHANVVELKKVQASKKKIFVVCEIMSGGELFDRIVGAGRFAEDVARKYFRQLVDGVAYCHEQGVAHRDLKPENLLLNADGDVIKITDFGVSNTFDAPPGTERHY